VKHARLEYAVFFFRKSHSEYGVLLENQCKQALVEEEDRKEQDEK